MQFLTTVLLLPLAACSPLSILPTRILAGVTVIDTPLVRSAINYTQTHEDPSVFNHSMRSWLFGTIIITSDPTYTKLSPPIDKEVHALGSILHDIGIAPDFNGVGMPNMDHAAKGGAAVRKFMRDTSEGRSWTEGRLKLLVDTVTMHLEDSSTDSGVQHAPEVRAVRDGQQVDLAGHGSGFVSKAQYEAVVREFPLGKMADMLAAGSMATGMGTSMQSGAGGQRGGMAEMETQSGGSEHSSMGMMMGGGHGM